MWKSSETGRKARYAMLNKAPVVRLAVEPNSNRALPNLRAAPTVFLSHVPGAQGDNVLIGRKGSAQLTREALPAILISFFYLSQFERVRSQYAFRDWALDSGAFSAHNSGAEIDLNAFIDKSKELLSQDKQLAEIYALDVIGDWKASRANTDKMWEAGVEAIPCFHHGEPWSALTDIAKEFPKIALGGAVGLKREYKINWAKQCFARVWPKKIHGFGFGSESQMLALPWHSVDATSWEIMPCKYGRWQSLGDLRLRGSKQNLRSEILWYLDLEQRARIKWRKQMDELERA